MQKITVTAPVLIEVAAPPPPDHGIKVREVDGGAVLDVPRESRKQLIDFGWLPPMDATEAE